MYAFPAQNLFPPSFEADSARLCILLHRKGDYSCVVDDNQVNLKVFLSANSSLYDSILMDRNMSNMD